MEPIKLVIWDLDETFWKGTLSEGPIEYLDCNHNMVIELTARGIVNSICSKNDYSDAMTVLKEKGIDEYFVFNHIDWLPKGPVVKRIIDNMQLRYENVLFIDDNKLNLEEAKYFAPGLKTAEPEALGDLLALESLQGKDDRNLQRLKHYRILEEKFSDRIITKSSNEDFLRGCQIRVLIGKDCISNKERILELISRTNQLNYTKLRVDNSALDDLLRNPQIEARYLTVSDRYGHYGISGFYCLQENRLIHFLFSCRIMDMGVEQWLYQRLGSPSIDIAGEVATPLIPLYEVDWIKEEDSGQSQKTKPSERCARVFIKGGCDIEQVVFHLEKHFSVQAEFNYTSEDGFPIHTEHTEILKRCSRNTLDDYGDVIDQLLFLDRKAFKTEIFSAPSDIYIYSVLMDFTQGLYRYRDTDFVVPFGDLLVDLTEPEYWPMYLGKWLSQGMTETFLIWFSKNFHFLGGINQSMLKQNLLDLKNCIPQGKPLVLINASEVKKVHPIEIDRYKNYMTMNKVLEELVKYQENIFLCDVRKYVRSEKDVKNNIRHYNRKNYLQISKELKNIIFNKVNGLHKKSFFERIKEVF